MPSQPATIELNIGNMDYSICVSNLQVVVKLLLIIAILFTARIFACIVYVVPMAVIVLGFTYTLGKRQLTEWQGRVLKLVSGAMMLGLGLILIINPALLNSVLVSFIILVMALGVSLLVASLTKRLGC